MAEPLHIDLRLPLVVPILFREGYGTEEIAKMFGTTEPNVCAILEETRLGGDRLILREAIAFERECCAQTIEATLSLHAPFFAGVVRERSTEPYRFITAVNRTASTASTQAVLASEGATALAGAVGTQSVEAQTFVAADSGTATPVQRAVVTPAMIDKAWKLGLASTKDIRKILEAALS